MPDRYSAGQGILGPGAPLTRTGTLNDVLAAGEAHRLRELGQATLRDARQLPFGVVKVVNGTSTALRLGEIVELNGHALTTVDKLHPWFTAAVPDETRPFAIMLEDVPNNSAAIGLAQIAGRCPALINVQATTDLWAFVESGQDRLKGDRFWGDVRLLFTPPGTGEQLIWVSIERSPQEWLGKTDAQITKGSSGTVSVWSGTPGSETDTTHNIGSVYNRWATVGSGKWVTVGRLHRKPYLTQAECPLT